MNFLNIIAATETLLNFNLNSQTPRAQTQINDSIDQSAFKKVSSSGTALAFPADTPSSNLPFDKIMEERQKLINQYLQLNIQLLEKQIHQKQKLPQPIIQVSKESKHVQEEGQAEIDSNKKKIKKLNNCGHQDKPHYAKGMCSNCYHRTGRVKKPWLCSHQKLYAAGLCQNCYINDYNRKKREEVSKIQGEKDEQSTLKVKCGNESIQVVNQDIQDQPK